VLGRGHAFQTHRAAAVWLQMYAVRVIAGQHACIPWLILQHAYVVRTSRAEPRKGLHHCNAATPATLKGLRHMHSCQVQEQLFSFS
jgi:hypothetical protein